MMLLFALSRLSENPPLIKLPVWLYAHTHTYCTTRLAEWTWRLWLSKSHNMGKATTWLTQVFRSTASTSSCAIPQNSCTILRVTSPSSPSCFGPVFVRFCVVCRMVSSTTKKLWNTSPGMQMMEDHRQNATITSFCLTQLCHKRTSWNHQYSLSENTLTIYNIHVLLYYALWQYTIYMYIYNHMLCGIK